MTSQGSAYARFRRALATRNLTLIRSAAAELPRVDLGDALVDDGVTRYTVHLRLIQTGFEEWSVAEVGGA